MKAFETFTIAGVKFLAIPDEGKNRVYIIDEEGNSYGAWMGSATFKKLLKAGKEPASIIGKVYRINFYVQ